VDAAAAVYGTALTPGITAARVTPWSASEFGALTCSAEALRVLRQDGSTMKWSEGLGVSGDTSCAGDHMIGWRVRKNLGLDHLKGVGGVSRRSRSSPTHHLRHFRRCDRRHDRCQARAGFVTPHVHQYG